MTTIISLKTKEAVFICSDSQVSSGNLRLALNYLKVTAPSNNLLIGCSGSVGMAQQLVKRTLREIRVQRVLADRDILEISPREFSEELADLNFSMPLQHKHFNPCDYLLIGYDEEGKNYIYSIGDDGSVIEMPYFHSVGSGSQLALSLLESGYNENLTNEEATALLVSVIYHVSKRDIYTNSAIQVIGFSNKTRLELDVKPETKEEVKT